MTYFFFNDTATTEIYTLSLHDALPICGRLAGASDSGFVPQPASLRPKPRPFGGGDFAPDPGSGAKSPPPNGRGFGRRLAGCGTNPLSDAPASRPQIGRASCRERV